MVPIIEGLINFLGAQPTVTVNVWDGEIPRYGTDGLPIAPGDPAPEWPVLKLFIEEPGFERTWTTLDAYDEIGTIKISMWAITRAECEGIMGTIEPLFALESNWPIINTLGGPTQNPYYVIEMLLKRWWSGMEPDGTRTDQGQLLYRCDMWYQCRLHGAIATSIP